MKTLSKIQAVLFTVILMVSIPISSHGIDGQRKLTQPIPPATFPIEINQSGNYVSTSNSVATDSDVNAITILVNDVTLNLNGHMMQGPNTGSGNGLRICTLDCYSITIKNGRIWGFGNRGTYLDIFENDSRRGAGYII